jgi:hypothetical protein
VRASMWEGICIVSSLRPFGPRIEAPVENAASGEPRMPAEWRGRSNNNCESITKYCDNFQGRVDRRLPRRPAYAVVYLV